MELDYKAIGKRIKIARIKADLTQERLAELIDISPTHLSNIETGTTRVSLNTIISIANDFPFHYPSRSFFFRCIEG